MSNKVEPSIFEKVVNFGVFGQREIWILLVVCS